MKRFVLVILLLAAMVVNGYRGDESLINSARIRVKVPFKGANEKMVLLTFREGHAFSEYARKVDTINLINGYAMVMVPISNYQTFIDIVFPGHSLNYQLYKVEPRDNITIEEINGQTYMSGSGSKKHLMYIRLRSMIKSCDRAWSTMAEYVNYLPKLDSLRGKALRVLADSGDSLPKYVQRQLAEDIVCGAEITKRNALLFVGEHEDRVLMEKEFPKLRQYFNMDYEKNIKGKFLIPGKTNAQYFGNYVFYTYKVDSCFLKGKDYDLKQAYNYLINNFNGYARERLLALLTVNNRHSGNAKNFPEMVDLAASYIHDSKMIEVIDYVKRTSLGGVTVSNYSFVDTTGKQVRISDFAGKVVVLDFWYNGCGNCREIKPVLEKVEEEYQSKNVVFLAINIDARRDRWLKGIYGGSYTSPLSVQLNTNGNGENDKIIKDLSINGYPTVLLIGKNGILLNSAKDVRTDSGKDLKERIEAGLTE
ncbi:TlpA disulfide reductase family protein [Chitinophaga sp. CC14]|uniref:TlpA family protein disulfide reductase n=1 Tax=Chitinophaga sp. CC14 TaxID=3029199 RepID=UPI003B7DD541